MKVTEREVVEASFERPVRFSRTGGSGPAAVLHDDRIHAPAERAVVPLLLRGAEAAARLWRLLPERLS